MLYLRRLRHILRSKYLFKILFVISLISSIYITNCIKYESKYNVDENTFKVKVLNIKRDSDKLSLLVKGKEKLQATYYLSEDEEIDISLGDIIEIKGSLSIPNNNTVPNTFNYQKYLYNNHIYYTLQIDSITKIENNTSLIYYIKNIINNRIDKITKSGAYIKTFVLGDKSGMDSNIYNSYKDNGISHLFSISGMHISLLSGIIFYFVKRISYNNFYNYGVVITFLLGYTLILGMIASVLRSIIMYILFSIDKLFNLKIKSIDLMLFVFVIINIIDPFLIYNIGFQYSYIISLSLIIFKDKLKNINGYFKKNLYISYLCFLVSFPITIYNFFEVNVLSIFLNVIVIPFVSVIIFPLSLITFIFPYLDNILYIFINTLEFISVNINKIEILNIIFSKPNIIVIILYYLVIYLGIKNKKHLFLFMIMLLIHKTAIYFNNGLYITFLDVGQGDSSLIVFPYNKANILIDTGGTFNSTYSIIDNKTIPYLKSLGITKLDYIIVTHGDYDHMGEAINLVNNFKVEKVIFNCGPHNDLEQELIKVLHKKKIPYYSCIKELNIDDNKLYFLNNKDYGNENDNSSVIYTKLNNHKFLFMGDAGVEVEEDLIEKYNLQNIDVLKVGHHGSKTSSSEEFIGEINPKYSVISVGKNNRYGHPNKKVLENLDDSKIYRTDHDGSIIFKIKNNKLEIETCIP